MRTKMYSGFQNILFTTPWNISPKAFRFHFEHYVSLQDWSPQNQVFYQREILRMYIIFPVIIDIITRCCDAALTWRIVYSTQALSYTTFPSSIFENCMIMLCTELASIIKKTIFNITAILRTHHTIESGVNFKKRNLKPANKIYLNFD